VAAAVAAQCAPDRFHVRAKLQGDLAGCSTPCRRPRAGSGLSIFPSVPLVWFALSPIAASRSGGVRVLSRHMLKAFLPAQMRVLIGD
jgi:hypothetical protein